MKEYTKEEIARIKAALPEDLKTALTSVNLMQELQRVISEQKLHVDEAGTLADIVELTLSGLLPVREFIPTLKEALPRFREAEILALAEAVNKRIFVTVNNSLREIDKQQAEKSGENVEVPLAPASTQGEPTLPIEMEKAAVPVPIRAATRDISYENHDPRVKIIPEELKKQINSDPYKEPIE